MKMRTLIMTIATLALAAAVVLTGTYVGAQARGAKGPDSCFGGPGPGMFGPHPPLGRLAEELDLTETQQDQLRSIFEEEIPAIHEQLETRISSVLTPEQQERFDRLKAERQARREEGLGGPGMDRPRGPRGRFLEQLDLTDEQKAELRAIFSEGPPGEPGARRERIAEILTVEQLAELEALREQRGDEMHEGFGRGGKMHPGCVRGGIMGPGVGYRGMMGPRQMRGARLQRLAEQLDLTDEQRAELRTIFTEEMAARHEQIKARVGEVLTPEQQSKLETLHDQRPGCCRGPADPEQE